MLFGGECRLRVVYVHYFKDIRHGALWSDCVMPSTHAVRGYCLYNEMYLCCR